MLVFESHHSAAFVSSKHGRTHNQGTCVPMKTDRLSNSASDLYIGWLLQYGSLQLKPGMTVDQVEFANPIGNAAAACR